MSETLDVGESAITLNVGDTELSAFVHGRPFSEDLRELALKFAERPVQLREILDATKGRGANLLLILVSLPFLTPIPLPGFSIPFGLVATIIGGRIALGQKPWLPQKLLNREIPARYLVRLVGAASRMMRWLEYLLHPRLLLIDQNILVRRTAGVLTAVSGLFLVLPLPIPFSNTLPACTIMLFAAGALERDGLAFIAGCIAFIVTSTFFFAIVFGGAHGLQHLFS